jgi:hypothetical protein
MMKFPSMIEASCCGSAVTKALCHLLNLLKKMGTPGLALADIQAVLCTFTRSSRCKILRERLSVPGQVSKNMNNRERVANHAGAKAKGSVGMRKSSLV